MTFTYSATYYLFYILTWDPSTARQWRSVPSLAYWWHYLLCYLLFILCLDLRFQHSQTVEKCPQLSFDDTWLLFHLLFILCLDLRSQHSETVEKCPQPLHTNDIYYSSTYYLIYVLTWDPGTARLWRSVPSWVLTTFAYSSTYDWFISWPEIPA
jgi:hypothetical protein